MPGRKANFQKKPRFQFRRKSGRAWSMTPELQELSGWHILGELKRGMAEGHLTQRAVERYCRRRGAAEQAEEIAAYVKAEAKKEKQMQKQK